MTDASHFPFEPIISVGLCDGTPFGLKPVGNYAIEASEEQISYMPESDNSYMLVTGMEIGCDFHWQQKLDLRFGGVLNLRRDGDKSQLINILKVESYLKCVVGSEMNPEAPAELVKAHAVISRSWALRQLSRRVGNTSIPHDTDNSDAIITWSESDAHKDYNVCADDHCQRYQGLDAVTAASEAAVVSTRGIVLMDAVSGLIADARFSKCCGGQTELFSTCWGDIDYPYLKSVKDEFCTPERLNRYDKKTLLKDYDRLTDDYFSWKRIVSRQIVKDNLRRYYNRDIGDVIDLNPLGRGPSGRIHTLEVVGSSGRIVIGKELAIRRLLSDTHLYSSAFDVSAHEDGFLLAGKGWGHGVGLCQIGAAVMACEGYTWQEILSHYYPGTNLSKLYE